MIKANRRKKQMYKKNQGNLEIAGYKLLNFGKLSKEELITKRKM